MKNFDITLKTKDDNESPELKELAIIIIKLRHYTEYWHLHHGGPAKRNMDNWKNKADEWIYSHISHKDRQKVIDKIINA